MDDVRAQLVHEIRSVADRNGWYGVIAPTKVAEGVSDAILERFDVTPKPVVTDDQLGRLVCFAHMGAMPGSGGANYVRGGRMREVLEQHGLKIVRVSE